MILVRLFLVLALSGCAGGADPNAVQGKLSQPIGLSGITSSSSEIMLSWGSAPAEENVVAYNIYRNDKLIATTDDIQYVDQNLFADTLFEYRIESVDSDGNTSVLSSAINQMTAPFSVTDVEVGDPTVSYANVEFTGDGQYMVWFEQRQDGSGGGTMWHCAVDPETGDLIPADGKGFRAFDSNLLGRANPGMDAQGAYYVGMNLLGELVVVRPTGSDSGDVTVLSTPIDTTRRAIYPSDLPDQDAAYVFWIKNEAVPGSGLAPGNDWFELQYISLDDPNVIHVIERQDKPPDNFAPMDVGFARWFRGKASISYGFLDENLDVQLREFSVAAPSTLEDVTDDAFSKIDPFGFVHNAEDIIVSGIDFTAFSHVYKRVSGDTQFLFSESIFPPDSELLNPVLAQSHERIIYDDLIYSSYQINEEGADFFETAFASKGEIWLTTILQSEQQQWRISNNDNTTKAEPEPYFGTTKVWVFYNALPIGADLLSDRWSLRRAETPIGAR